MQKYQETCICFNTDYMYKYMYKTYKKVILTIRQISSGIEPLEQHP